MWAMGTVMFSLLKLKSNLQISTKSLPKERFFFLRKELDILDSQILKFCFCHLSYSIVKTNRGRIIWFSLLQCYYYCALLFWLLCCCWMLWSCTSFTLVFTLILLIFLLETLWWKLVLGAFQTWVILLTSTCTIFVL